MLLNIYHSINNVAGRFYPHYLVSEVNAVDLIYLPYSFLNNDKT